MDQEQAISLNILPSLPSNLPDSTRPANPPTDRPRDSSARPSRSLWRNARAIGDVVYILIAWTIFTVLYMLFINYVLIEGKVQVGVVFFDAPTTNLLVSIFSQVFVVLATTTVHGLFKNLRLVLKNATLVTFFGISCSSGWSFVLKLLAAGWFPKIRRKFTYLLLREGSLLVAILGIPILGLAFGSLLKYLLSSPLHGSTIFP
jgi:magnesium-transporting ATPase (P-type)